MNVVEVPLTKQGVDRRKKEIQDRWSKSERVRRRQQGDQRRAELFSMILGTKPAIEFSKAG
ncbi:MAG: hypothetical protein ACI9HK_001235 [Pirellulaceae bacterium]|jgi:hypothetical protein